MRKGIPGHLWQKTILVQNQSSEGLLIIFNLMFSKGVIVGFYSSMKYLRISNSPTCINKKYKNCLFVCLCLSLIPPSSGTWGWMRYSSFLEPRPGLGTPPPAPGKAPGNSGCMMWWVLVGTWNQWKWKHNGMVMGYLSPVDRQTFSSINITFLHTSYAGGKNQKNSKGTKQKVCDVRTSWVQFWNVSFAQH